jgi:hypothetical protein
MEKRPDYPFDDFAADYDGIHADTSMARGEFERNVIRVNEHMKARYPDPDERMYKVGRFILIAMYLSERIHDFDRGDYAVYGSERVGALIGEPIIRAVHQIYTSADLSDSKEPSPEQVMQLADTIKGDDSR